MARYIDADAIDLGRVSDSICQWQAQEAIDDTPTADVVEVVRCKDCKHRGGTFHTDRREKEGGYWIYWCELDTGDPFELGRCAEDDNWFCKDGDRREDND